MTETKSTHPLPLGTRVNTRFPTCPCRGTKWMTGIGIIKRIQQRHVSGGNRFFYTLNTGKVIDQDWINEIL